MLPILAMLTSKFVLDAIHIGVMTYIGTVTAVEAADKLINNKIKQH